MQLLEHFNELSLHPKNAKELKGLILQLAVEGKLTSNWRTNYPIVESIVSLIKVIESEKTKLIEEKKMKKQKELPPLDKSDLPFEIPGTWQWLRWVDLLGLVEYPMKRGPFGSALRKDFFVENGIKVFEQYNAINDDPHWCRYRVTEEKYQELKAFTTGPGDLLVSCSGTLGRICSLPDETELGIINQALLKINLNNRLVSNEYFILMFRSYFIQSKIYSSAMGSAITNMVGVQELKQFVMPIPPLEEQKAIVEVVNQLFTEVDQLETLTKTRIQLKEDFATSALRQLSTGNTITEWAFLKEHFSTFFTEKSNIKKLRESILQLAVQGKLTANFRAENPTISPASELLERIKKEKEQLIEQKKIKYEKMIPHFKDSEIPFSLPQSWVWCRMQDVCPNISSGSTPPNPYFKESGVPYLKVYNIRNQKIDFNYKKQYVDADYHNTKLKRSILIPGDVIMNIVGPPLGKIAIIPDDFEEWNCNQAISFFQPLERKLTGWLYTFLCAGTFLDHIELIGTAGQDNISVTKSKTIMLPLPPLEEQKVIVEKVNALMALCDELEAAVEMSKTTQEKWMASSLREVFEGTNELEKV